MKKVFHRVYATQLGGLEGEGEGAPPEEEEGADGSAASGGTGGKEEQRTKQEKKEEEKVEEEEEDVIVRWYTWSRRYQAATFHLHGILSNPPRFRILKSGSIPRARSHRLLLSRVYYAAAACISDVKFVIEAYTHDPCAARVQLLP